MCAYATEPAATEAVRQEKVPHKSSIEHQTDHAAGSETSLSEASVNPLPAVEPVRFKNSPVPKQGNTQLCGGVATLIATEQALGVKLGGMREVFDLSTMLYSSRGRDGQMGINPGFVMDCYGLLREDLSGGPSRAVKYSIDDNLARIEQAVKLGDIAVVLIKNGIDNNHYICISDYRNDPNEGEQYKLHDSAHGKIYWESKSVFTQRASTVISGRIIANIIDCSQRLIGDIPVDTPVTLELDKSIHDVNFCQRLTESLKDYQINSGNEFVAGRFDLLEGSVAAVNISQEWQGEINQEGVKGLSRIFRSNLLAQRKMLVSINTTDDNGDSKLCFSTLVACNDRGFFFKVYDETVFIADKNLIETLSQAVPGWEGQTRFKGLQRNLILAYPRDAEGKAIIVPKKETERHVLDNSQE